MAYVVTGLSDYVQDNKDLITKDIVLGAKSIDSATIQPGVKGSANLNMLAVAPAFQDGSSCGWNASGDTTFSKRTIVAGDVKINMAFCKKTLIGKWTEYLVRFGNNNDEMPFGKYVMNEVQKEIKKWMEKMVWQGDVTNNSDLFDGWLTILNAASGTIKKTIASGKTAYEAIYQVYMAIPEEILETEGLCIRVSPKVFRAFAKELTDKNMYHYAADDVRQIILPGTNCPVIMTEGLADATGTNYRKIVATYDRNRVFGTDMMDDQEDISLKFSEDNDEWRLKANWNAGVQVAFPDLVVLGTMAADPADTSSSDVALGKIAEGVEGIAEGVEGIATGVTGLNADDKVFKTKEQA